MTLQELLIQQRKEFIESGIPIYEIEYLLTCIKIAYQYGELSEIRRVRKEMDEK